MAYCGFSMRVSPLTLRRLRSPTCGPLNLLARTRFFGRVPWISCGSPRLLNPFRCCLRWAPPPWLLGRMSMECDLRLRRFRCPAVHEDPRVTHSIYSSVLPPYLFPRPFPSVFVMCSSCCVRCCLLVYSACFPSVSLPWK